MNINFLNMENDNNSVVRKLLNIPGFKIELVNANLVSSIVDTGKVFSNGVPLKLFVGYNSKTAEVFLSVENNSWRFEKFQKPNSRTVWDLGKMKEEVEDYINYVMFRYSKLEESFYDK